MIIISKILKFHRLVPNFFYGIYQLHARNLDVYSIYIFRALSLYYYYYYQGARGMDKPSSYELELTVGRNQSNFHFSHLFSLILVSHSISQRNHDAAQIRTRRNAKTNFIISQYFRFLLVVDWLSLYCWKWYNVRVGESVLRCQFTRWARASTIN